MRRLIKIQTITDVFGLGLSTVYDHTAQGLFPPPIKIGPRASAWIQDEAKAVLDARIAGASDAEIRELVARLVEARKQPADHVA